MNNGWNGQPPPGYGPPQQQYAPQPQQNYGPPQQQQNYGPPPQQNGYGPPGGFMPQSYGNPLDDIENASEAERNGRAKPGMYEIEITRCLDKQTREKGPAFIAEYVITGSNNPEQPIGSSASWFRQISNDNQNARAMASGEIKSFIKAIAGFKKGDDENPQYQQQFKPFLNKLRVAGADARNIFIGMRLMLEATAAPYISKKRDTFGQQMMGTKERFFPTSNPQVNHQQQMATLLQRLQQMPNPQPLPQGQQQGFGGAPMQQGFGGPPPMQQGWPQPQQMNFQGGPPPMQGFGGPPPMQQPQFGQQPPMQQPQQFGGPPPMQQPQFAPPQQFGGPPQQQQPHQPVNPFNQQPGGFPAPQQAPQQGGSPFPPPNFGPGGQGGPIPF